MHHAAAAYDVSTTASQRVALRLDSCRLYPTAARMTTSQTDVSSDVSSDPPLARRVLLIRHAESEENVKEVQALRVVKKLVSQPTLLRHIHLNTLVSSSDSESLPSKTFSMHCYLSSLNCFILTLLSLQMESNKSNKPLSISNRVISSKNSTPI